MTVISGYWTGGASLPRSVQHHNVGIHIYAPSYASPTDEIDVDVNAGGVATRVRYVSPTQGEVLYEVPGTLTVGGVPETVGAHPRLASTWGEVCHLGTFMTLQDGDASLVIDFEKGTPEVG